MKGMKKTATCKDDKKYPFLGEFHDGTVVLFHEKGKGIVVAESHEESFDKIGKYAEDWREEGAKPYTGSVCLDNF